MIGNKQHRRIGSTKARLPQLGSQRRSTVTDTAERRFSRQCSSENINAIPAEVLAFTVDHGLIAAGVAAAIGSATFATIMISQNSLPEMLKGSEYPEVSFPFPFVLLLSRLLSHLRVCLIAQLTQPNACAPHARPPFFHNKPHFNDSHSIFTPNIHCHIPSHPSFSPTCSRPTFTPLPFCPHFSYYPRFLFPAHSFSSSHRCYASPHSPVALSTSSLLLSALSRRSPRTAPSAVDADCSFLQRSCFFVQRASLSFCGSCRLGFPISGVSPSLIVSLSSRELCCLRRHDRRVDDLPAPGEIALVLQELIKQIEQLFHRARLGQRLAIEPQSCVGNRILQLQPEAHEEKRSRSLFRLIVGEIVERLQHQRLEITTSSQACVPPNSAFRFAPAKLAFSAPHSAFQGFKRNHRRNCYKRIVLFVRLS